MKLKYSLLALAAPLLMNAQQLMTPEILWTLKKVGVQAVSPDQASLIYKVGQVDLKTEKTKNENYFLNVLNNQSSKIDFGKKALIQWDKNGIYAQEGDIIYLSKDAGKTWTEFYTIGEVDNIVISPDGKRIAFSKQVLVEKLMGKDKYSDTPKTTAQVYTDLNHRHWDYFNEGKYNHVFVVNTSDKVDAAKDLLEGKTWDSPQRPFGGAEDFIWSPDSAQLLYVTKPKSGKEYATSTNTDIFAYDLASGTTKNLTESNKGYDLNPKFSPDGKSLIWQSMARDGYEADKNDVKIMDWKSGKTTNLTAGWDDSVSGDVLWGADSKTVYFTAAYRGTKQLFSLDSKSAKIQQITKGDFDVNEIFTDNKTSLLVGRTDVNHATELFSVNLKNGEMKQVTEANKEAYAKLAQGKSELKMVKTSDGKEMGVWFHYPPNFDPNKKYPTLVYCQGGPQSALTQYFSVRWNFALMTANDYIVVAPNRRGMPGWGTKWNEEISKDWGGQPMRDYLAATDYAKTLPYVDGDRVAAVGASYGGYSVFMLAGIHENRFKTFIAHDGLFDMKSWYLTTEELWFANWDIGSPWEKPQPKAYTEFNPSNFVEKWNKPIMIVQGGIDFRVPYEQGQEAFQAAKLRGLKSKLVYFPNENHWVLHPQNGLVWQREFFDWLKETL
ncbi:MULTISPECIES: S9 family peptidase [Chryseobacterium]|uniref:Dipeptidyl aminopeptidase/acylaminoacyl peptidase n=1 Tax=Chryseobacterium rhizosphaerae TaxID=395937 RepID=A0AAE3YEP0_9FLAO|nr:MULTISPECIES: S9 family peptidase [Chryseobacterium]MDR6528831.1 dipeptidyl aminopeptidase/acylaminoacyl peptidase [Chryseobacterium rhizosphaerae]MDR6546186.1 dipeptidyl aminopeptidase/acylaminoacyl peptidase [Chryseobacterium rhizosphaerae]REC76903.1 S9 family peptidase [Chryseobacterium rhizosphaerae]SMC96208.1 Dipeptidyl aminopeptidase/acylaminoacyl peptidase [Chryseobacterium sp. YR221]GEN66401.1 peptidase S9 [Chryseobacterium rhizosphaerae]